MSSHQQAIDAAVVADDRRTLALLAGVDPRLVANVTIDWLANLARRQEPLEPVSKPRSATHANRGRELEDMLRTVHQNYRTTGRCYVQRTNPRVVRGKDGTIRHTDKAEPDYHGLVQVAGRPVALLFDAKQTQDPRWHVLSQLHAHQAAAFDVWEQHGGLAFVLLLLVTEAWLVPWGPWHGPGLAARYHELAGVKAARGRPRKGTASLDTPWLKAHAVPVGSAAGVDWLGPLVASLSLHKER